MCPLQSVLIDLDDTLFDHTHSVEHGLLALREVLPGLRVVEGDTLFASYNQWRNVYSTQLLAGEFTPEEALQRRFDRMLYSCGVSPDETDLLALVDVYRRAYREAERPVPGADALLMAFAERGLPVCVVTNSGPADHVARLERLDLLHLVSDVVTSEEAGGPKPDAVIFRSALKQMGVGASETVMIGDSWSQDVLGAQRVDIRAVWLNRHHQPHPEPGRTPALTSLHPLERVLSIVVAGHPN